jgi:hypothetical protein
VRTFSRRHPIAAMLLGTVLVLAAAEGLLLCYYLNSWFTMPLL